MSKKTIPIEVQTDLIEEYLSALTLFVAEDKPRVRLDDDGRPFVWVEQEEEHSASSWFVGWMSPFSWMACHRRWHKNISRMNTETKEEILSSELCRKPVNEELRAAIFNALCLTDHKAIHEAVQKTKKGAS